LEVTLSGEPITHSGYFHDELIVGRKGIDEA